MRASQASKEVCVEFEDLLQLIVDDMIANGLIEPDTWSSWGDIPSRLKYNMDEVGINGDIKMGKRLATTSTSQVIPSQ